MRSSWIGGVHISLKFNLVSSGLWSVRQNRQAFLSPTFLVFTSTIAALLTAPPNTEFDPIAIAFTVGADVFEVVVVAEATNISSASACSISANVFTESILRRVSTCSCCLQSDKRYAVCAPDLARWSETPSPAHQPKPQGQVEELPAAPPDSTNASNGAHSASLLPGTPSP